MIYLVWLVSGMLSGLCLYGKFRFSRISELCYMFAILFFSIFCGSMSYLFKFDHKVDPMTEDTTPDTTIDYCIDIGTMYRYISPLTETKISITSSVQYNQNLLYYTHNE